ncbi:hypothetical protein A3D78_00925 [Candidatus Gottesmanbacteria bacterium RIFCSPHIGHO2_02_FULL_39_14]|uniref:Penicillin-binding protein transpeptidase domain-containing protein n=1 Tax=Candidatus Gottesmanbacteria bacterium RIFCSPHIGHO2_02_FULL_39_14 TaxID=1798383 RepID=A0A1F6A0A8_9BACT|nr:MAG: hypothetical protein A3D78_00925 [Candidatus Gottesmanbacteria bacterium RIFCSPHIGHO2_02_FULL_39_14]
MEKRLFLVFFLFIIIAGIIVYRLFYWQIVKSESLKGLSQSQLDRSLEIKAKRGGIYTSDGSSLVINMPAFLVFAEPQNIKNREDAIGKLSANLNIDEASISAKLNNNRSKWIPIADKVDTGPVEKLKNLNLPGIGFVDDSKRFYPEASMAAHLLGFVGKDHNGKDQGYFGLEGYYNDQLKGRSGILKEEKDALGRLILSGSRQVLPSEDGRDLYLHLDKTVQFTIEEKLTEGIQKYGASRGTVIVMNPYSGAILGMASLPSYDPSTRQQYSEESYKNPAIALSYEPGSTFKTLIMAAAIDQDSVSPTDEFLESGPVEVGNYTIKTWNNQYHGLIKIPEIIQFSSNVGMVFIMEKLGQANLISYLERLKLGELTGIDLQDEQTPHMRDVNKWYPIDYATASFGQGIAITPLQMIRVSAAIANGGKLVTPYLVDRLEDRQGKVIKIKPHIVSAVFKKETAGIVTEMMVNAVEKGETKFLKPVGIRIAGKTGTAQIPIAGHYDTEKTIASFIGFFPADNPRIIMLVTLTEPTSSPWGSETAAPLFFNIAKELISYYNIPAIF